jgi:hypothetical protein
MKVGKKIKKLKMDPFYILGYLLEDIIRLWLFYFLDQKVFNKGKEPPNIHGNLVVTCMLED